MLKKLMLKRKIDNLRASLNDLTEKDAEFQTRESELEAAIKEASTDEEMEAMNEEVEKFDGEKTDHEAKKTKLSEDISELEKELEEEEKKDPVKEEKEEERSSKKVIETRGGNYNMDLRTAIRTAPKNTRALDLVPEQTRNAWMEQDDTKKFISNLRTAIKEKRTVEGAELTIPVVFLELIAENMNRYSKLLKHVRVRNVGGKVRQTIAGTVTEGIWTEMCGKINETTIGFAQTELDGYKVAGFIPVSNDLLEDSDINLAAFIIESLSESLGLAKDKAILYGVGANGHMPMGIVTRLAQSVKPAGYPANAPEWMDLHTTNILKIAKEKTGAEFFAELVMATSATANKYARGEKFWAMNERTLAMLQSKAISFTASGAIVTGVSDALPIVTGNIEVLEFIPDGDIIGGYGDLYLWGQRKGVDLKADSSYQFIEDNTVFRGKERADGQPVIPQGFVAINISGASVTTSVPFAGDLANDATLNNLTVGALPLSPRFDKGTLTYTCSASGTEDTVTATPTMPDAKVAITYNGKNWTNGSKVKWESGTHPMTVEVKNGNAVLVYTVKVTKG